MNKEPVVIPPGIVAEEKTKPVHARPSLYAYYFERLKVVAKQYRYCLLLHGSMNRDLDLVAVPWTNGAHACSIKEMIKEMAEVIGSNDILPPHTDREYGRQQWVINVDRGGYFKEKIDGVPNYTPDPQYYIDISVFPALPKDKLPSTPQPGKKRLSPEEKELLISDSDQLPDDWRDHVWWKQPHPQPSEQPEEKYSKEYTEHLQGENEKFVLQVLQLKAQEQQLRDCLGEVLDIITDHGWLNESDWAKITKAKSLLNPVKDNSKTI